MYSTFLSGSLALILEKEEAVRIDKALCGERISRRHYAELGSVERNFFCCFVCVDSNLDTIMSGWGCDTNKAEIIVAALKERLRNRGDTIQVQLAEKINMKTFEINEKVDVLMKHLKSAPEPIVMKDR
jgi:hypothetical protein